MKIVALKAKGLVLPSVHDSAVQAFGSLGAEVVELPIPSSPRSWETFLQTARSGGFDAVFTLDLGGGPHFASRVGEIQAQLGLHWMVWFLDDPEGHGFPGACDPRWTLAFCWDRDLAADHSSRSATTVHHLPLAADPQLFFPEDTNRGRRYRGGVFVGSTAHPNDLLEQVIASSSDLSASAEGLWERLVGDLGQSVHDLVWAEAVARHGRSESALRADPLCRLWVQACLYLLGIRKRVTLVRRVLGEGGVVFGDPGWKAALGDGQYRGPVAYGAKVRQIYNESAFVVEIRQPQARTGLTQRLFDASACGVPVIIEWSPELGGILDPREDIYTFRTPDEALAQRVLCLADPGEARVRADRARRAILARHTYAHRARHMLHALRQALSGSGGCRVSALR